MLIKAAINGGRTKRQHPSIPVTPDEQALAVVECLAAGASAIHLHVRSESGDESLSPEDVAATLRVVRLAAPEAQIGLSTGAWIVPGASQRAKFVAGWTELPDFASVNFNEADAVELARLLVSRGVGVEAGLCNVGAAAEFVNNGLVKSCMRVLLEPQEQQLEEARNVVREIERILEQAVVVLPRLLHGTESTTWNLMNDAIRKGYDIRVGFEDTLLLPDGALARTNGELVLEARSQASRHFVA
jgi:uncharacterized protein (DUF849 family)